MKDFKSYPFVVDKHNNVWKYIKDKEHFIKVTPWKVGEDRRVNKFVIEKLIIKNVLTQMKDKSKVHEIINNRWREINYSWIHDDKIYYVEEFNSKNDCLKAPVHKFKHIYKDRYGKKHEYFEEYRIGFYNGNIVWFNPYHYFPQLCVWEFKDINKEPVGYNHWTSAKIVRPIYNDKYEII